MSDQPDRVRRGGRPWRGLRLTDGNSDGSVPSFVDPTPAIVTVVGIAAALWLSAS